MHTAFILAAGFGTRLRPLTDIQPKPLVPICGVPLLEYALAACRAHGLTRVVVNAHWLAEQIEAWSGSHDGVEVTVSTERPDILGTGGGLKKVEHLLAERFVVLNGDVLQNVDLTSLLAEVPDGGGALVLRPHREDADRYGHVSADSTGTVVQMRDFASTEPQGGLVDDTHFTGIHALSRDLLSDAEPGFSCILRTAYTRRIAQRVIRAVRYDGPWLDIGDPRAYLDTNLAVLRGEVPLALDPHTRSVPTGARVEGRAWVGPGAEIHPDAILADCVIGAGARIGPVRVERSVVWDNVAVSAPLMQSIAYGAGILSPN